jgi:hypothetical protein
MTGWTLTCRGVDWVCPTEQDALGVLCYLRDYGREPLGKITVNPLPSETMAGLLAKLPNQQEQGSLL